MVKKMLWMVILVLITACSVYVTNGGLSAIDTTPTVYTTTEAPVIVETTEVAVDLTATYEAIGADQGGGACEEATATPIETSTDLPTETATATNAPTTTATVLPTSMPTSTSTVASTATTAATSTIVAATNTPTFTATATSAAVSFSVQTGSPVYMTNFNHPGKGCSWSGVGGQVFDSAGNPLTGYIVKITGKYNSITISSVGVTGMIDATPYGPGSFEIVLGSKAVASTNLLTIQVFDPDGDAVSNPLTFSTYADCSKNLMIINFIQQ
jgi:hypothetical protein